MLDVGVAEEDGAAFDGIAVGVDEGIELGLEERVGATEGRTGVGVATEGVEISGTVSHSVAAMNADERLKSSKEASDEKSSSSDAMPFSAAAGAPEPTAIVAITNPSFFKRGATSTPRSPALSSPSEMRTINLTPVGGKRRAQAERPAPVDVAPLLCELERRRLTNSSTSRVGGEITGADVAKPTAEKEDVFAESEANVWVAVITASVC